MLEKELRQLQKNNDKTAFEKIYMDTYKAVFSICYSILRNYFASQDVAQDTYLALKKYIGNYRGGKGESYIFSIAKSTSLNYLKKHKKEIATEFVERDYHNKRDGIKAKDESGIIKLAKEILNENEQSVVFMHTLGGIKLKEIAELLNKSQGTIRWQYKNALNKIKKEYLRREQNE